MSKVVRCPNCGSEHVGVIEINSWVSGPFHPITMTSLAGCLACAWEGGEAELAEGYLNDRRVEPASRRRTNQSTSMTPSTEGVYGRNREQLLRELHGDAEKLQTDPQLRQVAGIAALLGTE